MFTVTILVSLKLTSFIVAGADIKHMCVVNNAISEPKQ
jgi:hypothetical protein